MEQVYLIQLENSELFKIGYSKNPSERLRALQTANGGRLELIEAIETDFGYKLEKHLHRHYSLKRKIGEWFELNEEEVLRFKEICKKHEETLNYLKLNNSYIQNRGGKF